jgi:hypothetical protein
MRGEKRRENKRGTEETSIRDWDQEQNDGDFGSPHDQRVQKSPRNQPSRAESNDTAPFETTPFAQSRIRSGPEPAYGYPERRAREPRDERPTYEEWLREHENEAPHTEAERQLEGLQDEPPRKPQPRAPRKAASSVKSAPRADARASASAQVTAPRSKTRQAKKEKTSRGETKRRFEDNSEMSKL